MYLRVFTVARLVPHAAQRFIDNLDAVYQGSFNQALLEDSSPAYRLLKIFKMWRSSTCSTTRRSSNSSCKATG